MINFINQVGMFGWPLALIGIATIGVAVKHALALSGRGAGVKVDLGGLGLLGTLGLGVGTFSTLLGLYQGLQIFSQVSGAQAASGFARALLALLFGLLIFIVASVLRFFLGLSAKGPQSLPE